MKLFMFDNCPGEDYSVLVDASSTNVRFYKIPTLALDNKISLLNSTVAAYDVADEYIFEIPHKVFDSVKIRRIYNKRILKINGQNIKIYPSGFYMDVPSKTGMYWYDGKPFGVVVLDDQNNEVCVPQYILEESGLIPIAEDDIVEKPQREVKLIHCSQYDFEEELQKYLDDGYELYGNLSTCYCSPGEGVQVYQLVIKKNY